MKPLYIPPPSVAGNDLYRGHTQYCGNCNAFVPKSMLGMHNDFHDNYTNRKDGNMSSVLWCDPGNHAFKAKTPGSVHYQGTETDDNGMETTATVDACPDHNPFRAKPENIIKELNAEYPVTDV